MFYAIKVNGFQCCFFNIYIFLLCVHCRRKKVIFGKSGLEQHENSNEKNNWHFLGGDLSLWLKANFQSNRKSSLHGRVWLIKGTVWSFQIITAGLSAEVNMNIAMSQAIYLSPLDRFCDSRFFYPFLQALVLLFPVILDWRCPWSQFPKCFSLEPNMIWAERPLIENLSLYHPCRCAAQWSSGGTWIFMNVHCHF